MLGAQALRSKQNAEHRMSVAGKKQKAKSKKDKNHQGGGTGGGGGHVKSSSSAPTLQLDHHHHRRGHHNNRTDDLDDSDETETAGSSTTKRNSSTDSYDIRERRPSNSEILSTSANLTSQNDKRKWTNMATILNMTRPKSKKVQLP